MSGTDTGSDASGGGNVPRLSVPNAERYVLEADTLRRRQLRSALLHGSRRTWREHRRVWPAVVVGVIVVAVVVAAMAVVAAFRAQQNIDEEQDQTAAGAVEAGLTRSL